MTVFVRQSQVFEGVRWDGDNWIEVGHFLNRGDAIYVYRVEDFPYPMVRSKPGDRCLMFLNSYPGGDRYEWGQVPHGTVFYWDEEDDRPHILSKDMLDDFHTLQEHMEVLKPYLQNDAEGKKKVKRLPKPPKQEKPPLEDIPANLLNIALNVACEKVGLDNNRVHCICNWQPADDEKIEKARDPMMHNATCPIYIAWHGESAK